ncbi:MAG: B12-binding domain-containing protein, partial [Coriobacteriales bacterium]
MAILDDINQAIQTGKKKVVVPLVQQAIDEGIPASDILNALLDGFGVIGEKFRNDEVFVPEVLVAARAMNAGTALLKPLLAEEGAEPLGKAVLGTVEGDMHDIGKNIVRMMVEGKGIEVEDLGIDVRSEVFVNYVKE